MRPKVFHLGEQIGYDQLPVEEFLKRVNEAVERFKAQGARDITVGLDDLGMYAEDGQTIAVFAELDETPEQFEQRKIESAARSARSKAAWEKRKRGRPTNASQDET